MVKTRNFQLFSTRIMAKIRNIAKNEKWHNFLTVEIFCSKDLKNVIRSLFNVFIVCWSNPDSISVSIFPRKKNENYAFFHFWQFLNFT